MNNSSINLLFNPIQDGPFLWCSLSGEGGGGLKRRSLPKICHTYPTMMELATVTLYLKKIWKIYESHDTPIDFCWHQHFFTGNQQILLNQEIQIAFWYLISNILTFLDFLKIVLINMVTILMMSAKMANPGLLQIKVIWNDGYEIITSAHDVPAKFYHLTQIILLV